MNIEQIKYFIEVASTKHITHAAECLNISQPALSKSIASMEAELGIDLFIRQGRNIYISPAGETFLPFAKSIIENFENGKSALLARHNDFEKNVALATFPSALFPGLLQMLIQEQSNISLTRMPPELHMLEEDLLTGKLDLCLSSRIINNKKLNCRTVHSDRILLITSCENTLAKNEIPLTIKLLLDQTYVIGTSHSLLTRCYQSIFSNFQPKPPVGYTILYGAEVVDCLTDNSCVALITESMYKHLNRLHSDGITAIPLDELEGIPHTIEKKLYWRKNHNTPSVISAKNVIIDYFNKYIL